MVFIGLLMLQPTAYGMAASFKPDQVKAAFIYNLVSFVSWPEKGLSSHKHPFVISVMGSNAIARNLEIITREENINGRAIIIRHCRTISDIRGCSILFVGKSARTDLHEILAVVAGQPVLTIGDSLTFTSSGGMVGLIQHGKRISIEINIQAAGDAGIQFDSKLLKVARIVSSRR